MSSAVATLNDNRQELLQFSILPVYNEIKLKILYLFISIQMCLGERRQGMFLIEEISNQEEVSFNFLSTNVTSN